MLVYCRNHNVFYSSHMLRVKVNRRAFEVAMTKKNLSQLELARMIGFSRAHVSHVIRGRREPSPAMRRRILEQLRDYTFDDLFIIEENGQSGQSDG
jgi:putative transcriptional regulator